MTGKSEKDQDDDFDHLKHREPEPPFKVGQVVALKRDSTKRKVYAAILEIVKEDGVEYYRFDSKNCVSGSMIRWLTSDEMGR